MKVLQRAGVCAAWLGVFGISGAAVAAADRITTSIDPGNMVPLTGALHPQLRVATDLGRLDSATRIGNASLHFRRSQQQQAELETLLREQQTPGSPLWHQWLTPAQFGERFGMGQGDLARIQHWLEAAGLEVTGTAPARNQMRFSGTVAAIERAFGVELHHYRYDGETHFASATEPRLPAALDGIVLGLRNLDDFRPRPLHLVRRAAANARVSPQFTTGGGDTLLAPDDVATIYGIQPLYQKQLDGASISLAVVGQTTIDVTDIEAFRTAAGLPANDPVDVLVAGSGDPAVSKDPDDVFESDLDLEWAGAIAYGASVKFVFTGDSTNYNVFDALTYAIQNNTAQIISMSYGSCETAVSSSEISMLQGYAQQANSQGQTIVVASGDSGAAGCDPHGSSSTLAATQGEVVDFPADLAEITGVGGTQFSDDVNNTAPYWNTTNNGKGGSAISFIPEIVWNDVLDPGLNASGGGVSTQIPKPKYQKDITPTDGHRDVPDLAFSADPDHDPYIICSSGSCVNGGFINNNQIEVAGGTSVSAPVFAGILALLERATGSTGEGNVNTLLYGLASDSSTYAAAFHDVTSGDNVVLCATGSPDCPVGTVGYGYAAGVGYDQATGLGSMNVYAAAMAIGINPQILTSTQLVITPNRVQTGGAVTLTATITPQSTGDDALLGTVQFVLDGTNIGAPVTVVNKQASLTITLNPPLYPLGIHAATADYSGSTGYTKSDASATVSVLALPPAQDSKDGGGGALPPFMIVLMTVLAGWRRRRHR